MSSIQVASLQRGSLGRRVVLLGTPAVLVLVELGHPLLDHEHTISMLASISTWWIILHVLLIPLFALMGWAFFLLLQGIENRAATVGRYAAVVYTSFAIGFDAAVGLASGVLVSSAVSLPAAQQAIIQGVLSQLYESPAIVLSSYILFGAGIVTIVATALALASQGVPRLPLILLLGTILSAYSHALPFGPLGSACFFLAALWLELAWCPSLAQQHSPFQQTDAFVSQGEKTVP
jgi:hypothetical protein